MAISAGNAALQVVPVLTKNFSQQLATQMAGPAVQGSQKAGKEHGRRFGTSFSAGLRTGVGPLRTVFRGFGPGLAAAFGGAAIVSAIKSVTDEARESAIVGRQTAAVLKSTGGAANISAKQVGNLATALSNKTGADDEAIQSSQNLLLTFTGIRNEAGKGNDVFNQSSAAILDMTASMNRGEITAQGLKASTIQVGKALNDPIKGMTALSRVGVTFTEGQKAQVKAMVESGNKLGAQKLILAELRKEFGGSAEASADAGKRFGVFVGNLKEQIGTALLPILNRFLGFLVDKLPGALATVGSAFGHVKVAVQAVFDTFAHGRGSGYLDAFGPGAARVLEGFGVALRAVWEWVRKTASTLAGILVPAFRSIADAVAPAARAFVEGLLPGLKSLWHVVQAQVLPFLKILAAVIGVTLYAALRYVLPLILRLAGPVLGFLFKQLGQTIQWIGNVVRFIGRLGAWFLRWITGTRTTGDAVAELGRRVGRFAASMSREWRSVVRTVTGAMATMRRVTVNVLTAMIRFWLRWAGNVIDAAASALGWMPGLGPKLRTAQAKFHAFADSVNHALDKIQDEGVTVKIRGTFTPPPHFSMHSIVGAQTGYRIPGYGGGDRVPIMAEAGETVVSKEHSRLGFMREAFAAAGVPGFRSGGGVDVNVLSPNMGRLGAGIQRAVGAIADRVAASLHRRLRLVLEGGVGKAGILNFIRSVDPLPYRWGAAGPGAYDCSGLVGAVYGKMRGDRRAGHGTRYFTTSSINSGTPGLKSGLGGTLQIGVTSGMGHMAGRYGGLGFEARSTRTGIFTGAAARRPETFARHYFMNRGGPVDPRVLDALARAGLVDVGGDEGRMRINARVFDRGGWLQPGMVGVNTGAKAERVVGPQEQLVDERALARMVGREVAEAFKKNPPAVYLDRQKVSRGVADGALWERRR